MSSSSFLPRTLHHLVKKDLENKNRFPTLSMPSGPNWSNPQKYPKTKNWSSSFKDSSNRKRERTRFSSQCSNKSPTQNASSTPCNLSPKSSPTSKTIIRKWETSKKMSFWPNSKRILTRKWVRGRKKARCFWCKTLSWRRSFRCSKRKKIYGSFTS